LVYKICALIGCAQGVGSGLDAPFWSGRGRSIFSVRSALHPVPLITFGMFFV
jgi:hypothetical protein